jgi:signal transduction histidine kinase
LSFLQAGIYSNGPGYYRKDQAAANGHEEKLTAQKEISKAIINTQEKERSEIGKELHDNVNQILTTAKLYVENIEYYPEKSNVFVVKSKDLLQKSINEIRFLAKQLVTPVINDLGVSKQRWMN